MILRMVLYKDGRVLFAEAEGQFFTVAKHVRKNGIGYFRLNPAIIRYKQVRYEPWIRNNLVNRPCNIECISVEFIDRMGKGFPVEC